MLALLNLVLISFKVYSVPKMGLGLGEYTLSTTQLGLDCLLYLDLYEVGNQGGVKVC